MNDIQLKRMRSGKGFVAALDQSGGSTPKALARYGIAPESYSDEDEMFRLVHEMRTRIISSPVFTKDRILASIIFEKTMDSKIDDRYTADYLWEVKGILPILKVDKGLKESKNGVRMMKPIPQLDEMLERARERNIFGTKMRSVILEANQEGIEAIVAQQFELGKRISAAGFIPILEPEVDIHAEDKAAIENILKEKIIKHLADLSPEELIMFKLTLPEKTDLYAEVISHPNVVRVVALSGGYSREEANQRLSSNHNMIASFSRALTEGLNISQSDEDFEKLLDESIQSIYEASLT